MEHRIVAAALAGEITVVRDSIPDWEEPRPSEREDDPWDFLDESHGQTPLPPIEVAVDPRGHNILDLLVEEMLSRMAGGESAEDLAPVVLELIVNKGAFVSRRTLEALLTDSEVAALNRTEEKAQRFRRTVGVFALAAFGFDDFEERAPLMQQKLATWGLYGIAYKINHVLELAIEEVMPRGRLLHPAFMRHVRKARVGRSELRLFVRRMVDHEVMRTGLIANGHAWRMLMEIEETDFFEREVIRLFESEVPVGPAENPMLDGFPHTVLLADDDEGLRHALSAWLARMGFRVLTAADGAEAQALLARRRSDVDLVITDLAMPGLEGDALLARIRVSSPSLPVILQTVPPQVNDPDLAERVRRAGHATLIPKHDRALLEDEITRMLHPPRTGSGLGTHLRRSG